jgi:LacI family transcriptional regulator
MSKTTIRDIAEKAGVSTATVSRVLHKNGPISEETEQLVMQATRELNFQPRSMRGKMQLNAHRTLGVMIAGIESGLQENNFFAEVVAGASTEADRRNLSISIALLSKDPLIQPAMIRYGKIDGLIVAGIPIPDEQIVALGQLSVPTVFIGRYLDHMPLSYVSPDNLEGGRIAALHLKELGHSKIVILSGPTTIKTFKDRLQGAQEVLQDSKPLQIIICENFYEAGGYDSMSRLLDQDEAFTAVLSLSDWMALGAIRAMRERGVHVPQDVSVIGFSDIPSAGLIDPPLTTVHIPQRRLGSLAVHLAHSLIEENISGPVGIVVPLNLVHRASTAVPQESRHA